jgi:hypothetical protein
MNSGSASTLELPSQSTAGVPPVAIAKIGSQTISAAPGASTVVVQGQTLSAGGPPIMPSANIVASLGISGIIIQYPGGGVSSVALPTAVPQIGVTGGWICDICSTRSRRKIVIGSQTLTVGGTSITLGGNDVLSLGASGVVMQKPGGGITTIAVPTQTEFSKSISTSTNPIAGAIASSKSSPCHQYMLISNSYQSLEQAQ